MAYSQAELIRLMKEGKVLGETGVPKHVETVISNVFLFPGTVYKFYKNDSDFYNKTFRDVSGKDARFEFTRKDFAWNSRLSPSLYHRIVGVAVRDGFVQFVDTDAEAEELAFVMARVPSDDFVFNRLIAGTVTEDEAYQMGKELAENLSRARSGEERPYGDYFEIFGKEIVDTKDWMAGATAFIPEGEQAACIYAMERFRESNEDAYRSEWSKGIALVGDIHSHNAVYTDGNFYLLDTYPPKDDWRITYGHTPYYRLGSDLWALGSREVFGAFTKGYEENTEEPIDHRLDKVMFLYSATILSPYLYMLEKGNPTSASEKYHKFLTDRLQDLA